MQLEPSASFPSSIDAPTTVPDSVRHGARVVFGAWAGLVYLVYWLGYLGVLRAR